MKKIILLTSLTLSSFIFAGTSTVRIGTNITKNKKEKAVPYFLVEAEYSSPVYTKNKFRLSIAGGIEFNIGKKVDLIPVYLGAYINPTLDFMISTNTALKFGVRVGAGDNKEIYIKDSKRELITGEYEVEKGDIYNNIAVPINATIEYTYKNFSMEYMVGTKINYTDKNTKPAVQHLFNTGITVGYIIK